MTQLKDKVVWITGASSGIGAALAVHYSAPGRTLGLLGRDALRLAATASECAGKGAKVTTGLIDVCHANALQQWLLDAPTQGDPIDVTGDGQFALQCPRCGETHSYEARAMRMWQAATGMPGGAI